MRDAPSSAASSYALVGVVAATVGGVMMVAGAVFGDRTPVIGTGLVIAFVGFLVLESVRQMWGWR